MAEDKPKARKRMVVEEVGEPSETVQESVNAEPVAEIKEKVEELHGITEHMEEDLEKSEDVQDSIADAAEKAVPSTVASSEPKAEVSDEKPHDYISSTKGSGPGPLLILIPGVLLLGALLGGVYFYQKSVNQGAASPTPTPEESTPASSTTPSASPSAKLDLTKYPINVQNGSGIPGTAGSVKDLLTKAGFKVSASGNADNYNYTDTILKVKGDVPEDFVTKLTTTLSGIYKIGKSETLPDTSKDEVVVVVGSSKSQ